MMNYKLFLLLFATVPAFAQTPLLTNVAARKGISLNGKWQYIVDPYETGFYDYRWQPRRSGDREAYWNSDVPDNKTDRKEHGYTDKRTLMVPGDWNSQEEKFLYYEGTVWYKRSFDFTKSAPGNRVFLYFGAVNYRADVYLNGQKLGTHKGGFTPFNFAVSDSLLRPKGNFLVVKVDNKRFKDEVPTLNTDWWNYGGITREVKLIEEPAVFIRDYSLGLERGTANPHLVSGWVDMSGAADGEVVTVNLPELSVKKEFTVKGGRAEVQFELPAFQAWSPETPKRYSVIISTRTQRLEEKMGFRTIETRGKQVLLNGKPLFMRGICIHGEMPIGGRRAHGTDDARKLLGWAKELNCNMVRLAHYPHDEAMVRAADSLGILVWSEIPVYWTVDFTSTDVLAKAKQQLQEMITRDRNRASIIIWSVGNETPLGGARLNFMSDLAKTARATDPSRLISAALEIRNMNGTSIIDDPLGQYTDIVSVNEYIGWYGGLPSSAKTAKWEVRYDKPFFISETGAESLGGFHADSLTRWSEEYQEWFYREQVGMMKRMPDGFVGLSPWILADFRSPRRNNPVYQEGWNNKGLVDHNGKKKKAFKVLKDYYQEKKERSGD